MKIVYFHFVFTNIKCSPTWTKYFNFVFSLNFCLGNAYFRTGQIWLLYGAKPPCYSPLPIKQDSPHLDFPKESVVQLSSMQRHTERGVVQYSAVQCNTVQCSGIQCSAVQYSAVQCNTVQCSAVQCIAVYCELQYVQCSSAQCSS